MEMEMKMEMVATGRAVGTNQAGTSCTCIHTTLARQRSFRSPLIVARLLLGLFLSPTQGCLVDFDPPLEHSDFSIPDTEILSFLYVLQVISEKRSSI